MFHDFPSSFFNIFYPYLCFSGVSFPLNHPYLERVCCHGGFSCSVKADRRRWDPCRNDLAFQQVSPVFPFHGPPPQLLLVEQRHLLHIPFFDCLSMRHWNGSFALDSSRRLLCLSHLHLSLISFRVTSWHFVLTWLLSLSLIRRGSMRRSCVHDTGFCDCAGVGESGAV